MIDPELGELLGILILTNALGIVAKMVWDWLKNRKDWDGDDRRELVKNGNGHGKCVHHDYLVAAQNGFHLSINELVTKTNQMQTMISVHLQAHDQIKYELEKGSRQFETIHQEIRTLRDALSSGESLKG